MATKGMVGQIGIELPVLRKPGRNNFDARPKQVKEWVDRLPMGNMGESARLIFTVLQETNRLEIPWKHRFNLLESLRKPVTALGESIDKNLLGIQFPLQSKLQNIASLGKLLHNEISLGYLLASEDMLGGPLLFRKRATLPIMLHRSLEHLHHILQLGYRIYMPVPRTVWKRIHHLYHYAETHKLHERTIKSILEENTSRSNLACLYRNTLLHALANPYRLHQGELARLNELAREWSPHIKLLPYDPQIEAEYGLFAVHLNSDSPPVHVSLNNFPCTTGQCRLISLQNVLMQLRQMKEADKTAAGQKSDPDLLERLESVWSMPAKRNAYRTPARQNMEIVIGFTAIHRAISNHLTAQRSTLQADALTADHLFTKSASFSAQNQKSENDAKEDIWNLLKPAPDRPSRKPDTKQESSNNELPVHVWELRDQSSTGYRLARTAGPEQGLRVGDLLGLRPEDPLQRAGWTVCVVRWIQDFGKNRMEMGLQIISTLTYPLAARVKLEAGGYSPYQRILALPENPQTTDTACLMTPAFLFVAGSELLIQSALKKYQVCLGVARELTGTYSCFTIEDVRPRNMEQNEPATDELHTENPISNSLWQEISHLITQDKSLYK